MAVGSCKYPCPQNWNDFEDIIFHIYQMQNPGIISYRYGRSGQNQSGIDILVQDAQNTVIQCKNFTITTQDIDDIYNTIYFKYQNCFNTSHIIIANAGLRDITLQNYARNKKTVELWFWDDICSYIDAYQLGPNLFPTLYKSQNNYSKELQNFFSNFTKIINALGEQAPGYMFNIELLCFIGDEFIKYIDNPAVLELAKYQNILDLVSQDLQKIINIYTSEDYKSNGYVFVFDQSKDSNILDNNKKLYSELYQNIYLNYQKLKQLLI